MATKQVITVSLDGKLSGLDHKSKGLDLRQFGKAKIERATLIEYSQEYDGWFIDWFDCVRMNLCWTRKTFADANISTDKWEVKFRSLGPREVVYFQHYEDAVEAEVAVIQSMQLSGDTDNLFPN